MNKLFILILLILSSCVENSTNTVTNEEAYIALSSGVWKACKADGPGSFLVQLSFTGASIVTTVEGYGSSNDCTGSKAFSSVKTGTFDVTSDTESVSGYDGNTITANHFNITVSGFSLTPQNGASSFWIATGVCGLTSWVDGVATNTLGLTGCDPNPGGSNHPDELSGGVITNIILIDTTISPNKLYTNVNISSNGSVTSRPTTLDSSDTYSVELVLQ